MAKTIGKDGVSKRGALHMGGGGFGKAKNGDGIMAAKNERTVKALPICHVIHE